MSNTWSQTPLYAEYVRRADIKDRWRAKHVGDRYLKQCDEATIRRYYRVSRWVTRAWHAWSKSVGCI